MTPTDDLKGKFRTTSLRHIEKTGAYSHNGSLATLEDVVHFYNVGGGATGDAGVKDPKMMPLNLTTSEEMDLVELLRSLTGDPPPASLGTDTSAP